MERRESYIARTDFSLKLLDLALQLVTLITRELRFGSSQLIAFAR